MSSWRNISTGSVIGLIIVGSLSGGIAGFYVQNKMISYIEERENKKVLQHTGMRRKVVSIGSSDGTKLETDLIGEED